MANEEPLCGYVANKSLLILLLLGILILAKKENQGTRIFICSLYEITVLYATFHTSITNKFLNNGTLASKSSLKHST